MKKTIVALILILVMAASAGHAFAYHDDTAKASQIVDIQPMRLTLISGIAPALRVSGATATYDLSVICISSVNSIYAVLQIQRLESGSWKDYGSSWSASSTKSYLSTDGTKSVVSGYSYRLKVTITASNGSETGSATEYS